MPPTLERRIAERARPPGRAAGHQRWRDLLFAHWTVPAAEVQATLPPGLTVDTHEGAAYLGIVPFFMDRVRPAGLPPLPWLSWFLELNVRTYVHDASGRPGVWFYSLDCNQPIAVQLARRFFHLPYEHARMSAQWEGAAWRYTCARRGRPEPAWRCRWTPPRAAAPAAPGSLEHFLVERYTLFATDGAGRLCSGRVFHEPYRLAAPAEAQCSRGPALAAGFRVEGAPVSLLASPGVEVEVFAIERVAAVG